MCDLLLEEVMAKKRRYLTATLPDGYVKTIGPTTEPFTHYWRIVAVLENGKTEVFWGHARSLAEAKKKRVATQEAAKLRGWDRYDIDIVELVEMPVDGHGGWTATNPAIRPAFRVASFSPEAQIASGRRNRPGFARVEVEVEGGRWR